MARQIYDAWLPEEWDSQVMTQVRQTSAIEALARRLPMNTDTKAFPRTGAATVDIVPKGSAYGEDTATTDDIVLQTKKFGKAVRIAEEDIDDTVVALIETKKLDWASAYARMLDNACLGVNAAIGTNVPFTSVYRAVTTAEALTGYTASANLVVSATGVAPTYADFSKTLGLVEASEFFDEAGMAAIAHPAFRAYLRGILSTTGQPIFSQGLPGTPDTVFGMPIHWSKGAKVTATATANPPAATTTGAGTPGNPLFIMGDPDFLMLGIRSGPESVVIPGRDGVSALTDETILKMRSRRAFAPAFAPAFAVLEDVL